MWHQRLKPEGLKNSILRRVQERLGDMYKNPEVRERAERFAYNFAYTAPMKRMKKEYMNLVNEGSDYVYGSIIK
jgi:hypothetical protein